jgi:hypothetical protein
MRYPNYFFYRLPRNEQLGFAGLLTLGLVTETAAAWFVFGEPLWRLTWQTGHTREAWAAFFCFALTTAGRAAVWYQHERRNRWPRPKGAW